MQLRVCSCLPDSQENKEGLGDRRSGIGAGGVDTVTHSDEGEDVVHVGADVDLHKAHHHSHLLEKELENKKSTEKKMSKRRALRLTDIFNQK